MKYEEFLKSKIKINRPTGLSVVPEFNSKLFDFQHDITSWALRMGRAAIFADCGLGKTPMQLEWARHVPGDVLIVAPLAVSQQTIREGKKFGIKVHYCRSQDLAVPGVNVTNYEMLKHFEPEKWTGVVLDESSIIKHQAGKFRQYLIEQWGDVQYRLTCTATPAPNDFMEIGNHAEFLGVCTMSEMLATYFVHDGGETQKWRLKGHAEDEFWRWMCSWAVMIRKPSDLGYQDRRFKLPPIKVNQLAVESEEASEDFLFPVEALTLQERIRARKATVNARVEACANLVAGNDEPWIVWCNLNSESEALVKAIPGAVGVSGSDSIEHKQTAMLGFGAGDIRVLVTKPSIAGFGMNWQHCNNVAFVGLSDSWEQYYQAIRRCWRFGQKKTVNVWLITADIEGAVVANIKRKEEQANKMVENMVEHMHVMNEESLRGGGTAKQSHATDCETSERFTMHLGDCIDVIEGMEPESVHYSVFSPPFASLYTYSASERDMGNSANENEFMVHFGYLCSLLFKVLKPGRNVSIHCMNYPTTIMRDGYIGCRDFRGDMIRAFQDSGFVYHSEVCIWKDPVTQMQRTKALGLLHKQLKKDSIMSRQGWAEYLVTMRKPGDNAEPVQHTNETFPVAEWQQYASPVWMDINPSDTLQYRSARDHKDEKHICPLQLEVIRRALRMWTNRNDVVLSPFAGIGSEGHVAISEGRQFVGVELKPSYWKQAVLNLKAAETDFQGSLLSSVENA